MKQYHELLSGGCLFVTFLTRGIIEDRVILDLLKNPVKSVSQTALLLLKLVIIEEAAT